MYFCVLHSGGAKEREKAAKERGRAVGVMFDYVLMRYNFSKNFSWQVLGGFG